MDERTAVREEVKPSHSKISHLSWEVLSGLIAILVRKIQAEEAPEIIVGVQRGGLIPAVMLSHACNTQTVLSLPIRSTTSDAVYASKMPPVAIPQDLFQQVTGRDILVIDDVVGSGATLRAVVHMLERYEPARIRCATCCVNRAHWDLANDQEPASMMTYIGKEVSGWVVFPWEKSIATTSMVSR